MQIDDLFCDNRPANQCRKQSRLDYGHAHNVRAGATIYTMGDFGVDLDIYIFTISMNHDLRVSSLAAIKSCYTIIVGGGGGGGGGGGNDLLCTRGQLLPPMEPSLQ